MKKKTLLLTGTSGFLGNIFLRYSLSKGFKVVDILRDKNKNNTELKKLRKIYRHNYHTIFFFFFCKIEKKIKKLNIDFFINFATFYKNTHSHNEIPKFIKSNILFPTTILDLIYLRVKEIINFGTMMQHSNGKGYSPSNLYASTKNAFEMIAEFYLSQNKKLKFYNLKFYESFSEKDHRKKLIPTLIKNFKNNVLTKINSKNLEMNIIHTDDIINAILILLNNNLKSGTYILKQKKNIKINRFIANIKKNNKKTINVKYLSKKQIKPKKNYLKILPKWKPDINISKRIEKRFYYEDN